MTPYSLSYFLLHLFYSSCSGPHDTIGRQCFVYGNSVFAVLVDVNGLWGGGKGKCMGS